MAVAPQSDGT